MTSSSSEIDAADDDSDQSMQQPRLWRDKGWTAKVVKNEDDDGWAVEMLLDGESEPALVGPWTMGRDKKNPKPLDVNAFNTLVKTASEVLRRHEQQLHALLHKKADVETSDGRISITLDIVPDEYEPHAILSAHTMAGEQLAQIKVGANFLLNQATAAQWVAADYRKP